MSITHRRMRNVLTMVATLTAVGSLGSSALEGQRKPRVAVLDFEARAVPVLGNAEGEIIALWRDQLPISAAALLVNRLVNSGDFEVMDRKRLQEIIREQDIGAEGATDLALALGRIKAVDYLISGAVTRFSIAEKRFGPVTRTRAEAAIDIQFINTTTAQISSAISGSAGKNMTGFSLGDFALGTSYDQGLAESTLEPAMNDLLEQVAGATRAGSYPPTFEAPVAEIVGVAEGSVDISQGSTHGIEVGQEFEVHRVVREIVVNGEVKEVITDRVGLIRITRVFDEVAIAEIVEGEAAVEDTLVPVGG